MSNWPEHSAELARKALETLHAAGLAHEEGTMTAKEFRLVINTILDVAHGLMPEDVVQIAIRIRKELDDANAD